MSPDTEATFNDLARKIDTASARFDGAIAEVDSAIATLQWLAEASRALPEGTPREVFGTLAYQLQVARATLAKGSIDVLADGYGEDDG